MNSAVLGLVLGCSEQGRRLRLPWIVSRKQELSPAACTRPAEAIAIAHRGEAVALIIHLLLLPLISSSTVQTAWWSPCIYPMEPFAVQRLLTPGFSPPLSTLESLCSAAVIQLGCSNAIVAPSIKHADVVAPPLLVAINNSAGSDASPWLTSQRRVHATNRLPSWIPSSGQCCPFISPSGMRPIFYETGV